MRILIVEDEPTLVEQLAEALDEAGYAVDRATDGEDAAHLGATEPFDAVILDLGLPQRDGLSVLRDWRANGVNTPVLVLTGKGRRTLDKGLPENLGPVAVYDSLARFVDQFLKDAP